MASARFWLLTPDTYDEAAQASSTYAHDVLTMLVPLIVELRWKRGYASGLKKLLNIPNPSRYLRDFQCEKIPLTEKIVEEGVLSAEQEDSETVLITLEAKLNDKHRNSYPVVRVRDLSPFQVQTILNSLNRYGRLVPTTSGLSLFDRICNVEVDTQAENSNRLTDALYRNREALIPLIARHGMPGSEWLLPDEEAFISTEKSLLDEVTPGTGSGNSREWVNAGKVKNNAFVQEFLARKPATKKPSLRSIQNEVFLQQLLKNLHRKR